MPTSEVFIRSYKKLNPEQKQAVDAIDGPVMVVAGPGTGKTQILTLRIANILSKTDTKPEQILALTFTESGVSAMRKRLTEIIGTVAYRVPIHTFHSFSNMLIGKHPDMFPRIIGAEPIADIEKASLFESLILETPLEHLRPYGDPLFYLREVRGSISDFKRENISPDDLAVLLKVEEGSFGKIDDLYHTKGAHVGKMKGKYESLQKKLERNKELLVLYRAYEDALTRLRRYDFEDMILEVLRAFERSNAFLLEVQETYQYLLADEHQDANRGQNQLLEKLTDFHTNPNLFIVGDEKQAIFRFQGASLDNFLYFKKKHPSALLIPLTSNYRSRQGILDAAHSLIGHAPGDEVLRIPLVASADAGHARLRVAALPTETLEEAYVGYEILRLCNEGVSPEDIAVIYRTNADGVALRLALQKQSIPTIVESDHDALQDRIVRALVSCIRLVERVGDDTLLPGVLHIPSFNFDPVDVYRFISYGSKRRISLFSLLKDVRLLRDAGIDSPENFHSLYERLSAWRRYAEKEALPVFAARVFRESGLLEDALTDPERDEIFANVRGFLRGVGELQSRNHGANLQTLAAWIDAHGTHRLSLRPEGRLFDQKAVRLMTAHKSKGLEFKHVFVTGLIDGHWGNQKSRHYFHIPGVLGEERDTDDERRLLYVAITRGKESVTLSYSAERRGKPALPAIFLEEIDSSHIDVAATDAFLRAHQPEDDFKDVVRGRASEKEREYLSALFLEQGISVTALNNYLDCPWKYFYSNLLRVPQVQDKVLLYGSAIHEALRYVFEKHRLGEDVGASGAVKRFNEEIQHAPLREIELEELRKKGEKALTGYYRTYKNTWVRDVYPEHPVTASLMLSHSATPVLLRGKLDRMDVSHDGVVSVVDYKTGKPKSRNEIEGKTKSGTGDYKRQLVFYKLLLALSDEKRDMKEGTIDFVEPDDKGRYHREIFAIDNAEMEELQKVVERVAEEILSLSFWGSSCDDTDCIYCDYAKKLTRKM